MGHNIGEDGACRYHPEIFESGFLKRNDTHSNIQRAKWIPIKYFNGAITQCGARIILTAFLMLKALTKPG
jgi:hypothetical protein